LLWALDLTQVAGALVITSMAVQACMQYNQRLQQHQQPFEIKCECNAMFGQGSKDRHQTWKVMQSVISFGMVATKYHDQHVKLLHDDDDISPDAA
jgi:hypothetical protein